MEWWYLFRNVRRVVFAVIAIASLAWAIALSIYLSKQWPRLSILQRAIVIAFISVNSLTSVLLYLMIVVIFRMWKELLRMLFLLAIHTGTAVPFTLYWTSFSCAIYSSKKMCEVVELAFLSSAWSITGLLLGYTIYLCIMSRVPRPFPVVTPNELLHTPPVSRAPSMASIHSATRLLSHVENRHSERSASPQASIHSQSSRTIPKRIFVANTGPYERAPSLREGAAYGAADVDSRPELPPSVNRSRFSTSTIGSVHSPSPPSHRRLMSLRSVRPESLFRRLSTFGAYVARHEPSTQGPQRPPPRPLLLNPEPFVEPLSRNGTPPTAASNLSFTTAPASLNLEQMAPPPYNPTAQGQYYGPYLSPYSLPSGSQLNRSPSPQVYLAPLLFPPYMHYAGVPVCTPSRTHSATPSTGSIHSMSPSIHFDNPAFPLPVGHPAALTPAHSSNGNGPNGARLPPAAHLRSASDPVYYRSHSAEPRIDAGGIPGLYDDVMLPNPYAGGAEIRRYASVPHVRSPGFGGRTGVSNGLSWTDYGARDLAAGGDLRWREEVMKAAGVGRGL